MSDEEKKAGEQFQDALTKLRAMYGSTGSDLEKTYDQLKGEYDEAVWDHLAGNLSAPFTAGEHRQIAVKVIDDRGNELLVVKPLPEAKG